MGFPSVTCIKTWMIKVADNLRFFLNLSLQRSPQITLKRADKQATGCMQKITVILAKISTFISQTQKVF